MQWHCASDPSRNICIILWKNNAKPSVADHFPVSMVKTSMLIYQKVHLLVFSSCTWPVTCGPNSFPIDGRQKMMANLGWVWCEERARKHGSFNKACQLLRLMPQLPTWIVIDQWVCGMLALFFRMTKTQLLNISFQILLKQWDLQVTNSHKSVDHVHQDDCISISPMIQFVS